MFKAVDNEILLGEKKSHEEKHNSEREGFHLALYPSHAPFFSIR